MSELKEKAEAVLVGLIEKAAEVGSAAIDEIPLVVQELLQWKFIESLLTTALVLFVTSGLLHVTYRFFKWGLETPDGFTRNNIYREGLESVVAAFAFINISWIFILIVQGIPDFIKIWVAPRVYLLEYAAQLVK